MLPPHPVLSNIAIWEVVDLSQEAWLSRGVDGQARWITKDWAYGNRLGLRLHRAIEVATLHP